MWITSMGIPIASWSSSPSNSAVAAAGRRRIPVRAEKVKGSRPDTERLRLDRQSRAKAAGVYKGRSRPLIRHKWRSSGPRGSALLSLQNERNIGRASVYRLLAS